MVGPLGVVDAAPRSVSARWGRSWRCPSWQPAAADPVLARRVGLEPGLCLGPVVAEPVGVESLGVSEPVVAPSVGAGVCTAPAGGQRSASRRKRSWAVEPIVRSRSLSTLPGISTTMMSLPWVETSDSATPAPLTRLLMIPTASSSLSLVTDPPPEALAWSVIRVPPWRSSPSLGFHEPTAAAAANMPAMTSRKTMSVRPGREVLVATSVRPSAVPVVTLVRGDLGGVGGRVRARRRSYAGSPSAGTSRTISAIAPRWQVSTTPSAT